MQQLTWKFVHIDIEIESNGFEFCYIEIDLVLLHFVSRIDWRQTFLFFLSFFTFSRSEFLPSHSSLPSPKTHEQNQTQNPKQISDQIRSSPPTLLLLQNSILFFSSNEAASSINTAWVCFWTDSFLSLLACLGLLFFS